MLANSLDVSIEQCGHLLAVQPHCFLLHPHLEPDAVVGLVEDDFAVLSQVVILFPKPQHPTSTHVPKPFPSPTHGAGIVQAYSTQVKELALTCEVLG